MNYFEKRAMAKRAYRALVKMGGGALKKLPAELAEIYNQTPDFSEGEFQRKLSPADIASASRDYNIDFESRGLIPLYDKGDNDFVVYNTKTKQLEMFNIADELPFMSGRSLNELISRR